MEAMERRGRAVRRCRVEAETRSPARWIGEGESAREGKGNGGAW